MGNYQWPSVDFQWCQSCLQTVTTCFWKWYVLLCTMLYNVLLLTCTNFCKPGRLTHVVYTLKLWDLKMFFNARLLGSLFIFPWMIVKVLRWQVFQHYALKFEILCPKKPFWYTGEAVSCCSSYGKGTDAIHIRDVGCSGTERNVTACSYYNVTVPRRHDYDVGVQCQQGKCTCVNYNETLHMAL